MAHSHLIKDADAFFEVNHITRQIINKTPQKITLIQGDHNSEVFTFSLPRYIEGHNMAETAKAEVHFINIESGGTNTHKDVYVMKDLHPDPDDDSKVICSWLIAHNATQYAGTLNFMIRFACVDAEGNYVYVWNTETSKEISISTGMDNGEAIVEEYPAILEQWRQDVLDETAHLTSFFKTIPDGRDIDTLRPFNDTENINGTYLIDENTVVVVNKMFIDDEYFGPYATTHQLKHEFDGSKYNIYERIYKKYDFDGIEGFEWEEFHPVIPTNIENGVAESSIQSNMSSVGAKVFKFDLTHEYTDEDIADKRYYLDSVNQLMFGKPFSIVLGENYDFHGKIQSVNSDKYGWYVKVDNYIAPSKTDTRHMISESSYILLPYDIIEDGGDYVPFDHYKIDDETIFGNAHMMGDTPIGIGGASLGYKCYAQNIGTFSAGYMNISSGKYSGTLGRYNVTGYCDFAFGQDIKLFGHWQTGFGRDIFMAQNADFSFGGGRFNKSYGPYQFFAGEGHELYLPYANARGKYSITDSNKYVDKFGWGAAGARKNLYTLDANGNTWFAGEIRCGESDYDAAARVAKTYSVSSLSALTSLDAKKGDMAIYMNTQQEHWCKLGADGENNGLAVFSGATSSDAYTVDSEIGGRKCRKIPTQAEHPTKRANRFMYFAMEDLTAAASEITFKIIYYDLGTELIQIQYNAADGAVTKAINVCYRTNTKRWKEATITISDAGFVHSTAIQKQDFRICGGKSGIGADATYIAEMSVTTHKNTESGKNIHKDVYVLSDNKNTLQNWVKVNNHTGSVN